MPEKPEADVRAEVQRLLEEIERRREEHQGEGVAFAALNEEQLTKKIRGETSNSPFFCLQSWLSTAAPGAPAWVEFEYWNPDPRTWNHCVTIFFGLANFAPDLTAATAGRHTAWPYISDRPTNVGTGQLGSARFDYTTPMVERGTYLGNGVLWQPGLLDIGTYFARTFFQVTLV
jgi:hypothetical protein